MEEAIAKEQAEQAAALADEDASDDGSFEFEPMDELTLAKVTAEAMEKEDTGDMVETEDTNADKASGGDAALSSKRRRAAGPAAARRPAKK